MVGYIVVTGRLKSDEEMPSRDIRKCILHFIVWIVMFPYFFPGLFEIL